MPRQKDVAYAYHLRERARGTEKTRRTTDNARTVAFIAAAEATVFVQAEAFVNSAILRTRLESYGELCSFQPLGPDGAVSVTLSAHRDGASY